MVRVEGVIADISGGHAQDRNADRGGDLTLQAVEVLIDGAGLPAGVGEDRVVDLGKDTCGGQGEQGTGLDSGAEREGAELGLFGDGGSWRAWGAEAVSARRQYGYAGGWGRSRCSAWTREGRIKQAGCRGDELLGHGREKSRRELRGLGPAELVLDGGDQGGGPFCARVLGRLGGACHVVERSVRVDT